MFSKSTILDIIQTVVISFAAYMVIHLFVMQPNKVDGSSMFPTMHTGERFFTSKLAYKTGEIKRGDIIVFTPPDEKKGDYVKRVIALPGETVTLKAGSVYINGTILPEAYLPDGTRTVEHQFLRDGTPFTVPVGNYIAFGDNRNFSSDSREWGPIKRSSIIGKAWVQYWPISEIKVIQHQSK